MFGLKRQQLLYQIYIPASLILDLSSIVLNGLISYVLWKHKKTRIVTFWFIYCLSMSDVMVGATGLIYHSLQLDIFFDSEKASWNSLHEWFGTFFGYSLLTSWMLILIIAIDRCIHMTRPHKYSVIVTKCKARIVLLFSIVFCIFLRPPSVLASKPILSRLRLFRYIIYTVGTFGVFVIYLVLYFVIKRRVAALQNCEAGKAEVQDTPDINVASGSQHSYECSRMKRCKKINAMKNLHNFKLGMVLKKKNDEKESHKENFPSPFFNAVSPINYGECNEEVMCMEQSANCEIEKLELDQEQHINHIKMTKQNNSCYCKLLSAENPIKYPNVTCNIRREAPVEPDLVMQTHSIKQPNDFINYQNRIGAANNAVLYSTDKKACTKGMAVIKRSMNKPVVGESVNKASRRRLNTADEDVKKVASLILLALFISYVPSIINFFYLYATGTEIAAIAFIAHISVLFNSSLNAVILIACSKDIHRKVKAVFL